ncbi:MAG: glycosyltransferase family 9 protein [Planctomycetota bacterium]
MSRIAILKTGALGDVLRTTSILPGLHGRYAGAHVTWVTAHAAVDLVARHPQVAEVVAVDPRDPDDVARATRELAGEPWERVLSFDDEVDLCRMASTLAAGGLPGPISGAYLAAGGERRYTDDVAPWFDMGLLSVHGKEEADRRKVENDASHPAIFARMLGIEMGEPELPLPEDALTYARGFAERTELAARRPVVGLNTGAGGRWESKRLSEEGTAALVGLLHRRLGGGASFLLLGGPEEAERNAAIAARVAGMRADAGPIHLVDAGTDNPMTRFGGLVDLLDLLVTSDSLAMHVAIARRVPVVAFFAPTSAAEIELYGRGERVVSTAPDYCSYRPDADNSSITPERIADAVERVLGAPE